MWVFLLSASSYRASSSCSPASGARWSSTRGFQNIRNWLFCFTFTRTCCSYSPSENHTSTSSSFLWTENNKVLKRLFLNVSSFCLSRVNTPSCCSLFIFVSSLLTKHWGAAGAALPTAWQVPGRLRWTSDPNEPRHDAESEEAGEE